MKNFENSPEWQRWIQGHWGRASLILIAAAAFGAIASPAFFYAVPALALVIYFPKYREAILGLAAIVFSTTFIPDRFDQFVDNLDSNFTVFHANPTIPLSIGLFLGGAFCIALGSLVARLPQRNFFRRHALALLLSLIVGVTLLISPIQDQPPVWAEVIALFLIGASYYVWFFAYDVRSGDFAGRATGWRRFAYYRPFWTIFYLAPIPRGEYSMKSQNAQNDEEVAQLRLRAIRLLLWALTCMAIYDVIDAAVYGQPAYFMTWMPRWIPVTSAKESLEALSHGQSFNFVQTWTIALCEFFHQLLYRMAIGHLIIAVVWACGYFAKLNVDRPVGSLTFLEFFNRYNYYYKELLLNIFYYPTHFGRLGTALKKYPRTRLTVSVFASVGLGNLLVRWFLHINYFISRGMARGMWHFRSHVLYCLLLSLAVSASLVAEFNGSDAKKWGRFRRILAILGVTLFYTYIHLFDETFSSGIAGRNFDLALSALGLN